MNTSGSGTGSTLRHVVAAVASSMRAGRVEAAATGRSSAPMTRFVTISREAGAGGGTLGQRLAERLNRFDSTDPPWACFDRELVEKVASDHQMSAALIDALEEQDHSWLSDFFSGLSLGGPASDHSEAKVYERVAKTIRAIAGVGRVIIVGRGGVFITRNMPGGLHLRLVAPLFYRVENMARLLGCSEREAEQEIHRRDRNREAFYRRYFSEWRLTPDVFTMTLNTAPIDEERMIDAILPLIVARAGHNQLPEATKVST